VLPLRKKDTSFWDHVTVGRAPSSDIVLEDPAVSNAHAHFEIDERGEQPTCWQDTDSSNGTYVNRERIQAYTLTPVRSGDCIRFGQSIFYYVGFDTLREMLAR